MSPFKEEAHTRWMEIYDGLEAAAEKGEASESLESARDNFFHLSQAAIELHDTFGHSAEQPYYLTFCPMARDNAGAYWLQEENIVWNSFYGEAMLRCGEIKQELHAGNAATE
jgi:Cu(I)/Ag(I) efflux system membrane fusion protein